MDLTFKYPGKVNNELAEHYKRDACWRGGAKAKNDAATAKRMATQLFKTLAEFERALGPEHQLSVRAAAIVMETLAMELNQVENWAKKYKLHCDQVSTDEEAKRLDEIAHTRWADDDVEMLREACALIEFHESAGEEWLRRTKQLNADTLVCGLAFPNELKAEISKPANRDGNCTILRRLVAQTWRGVARTRTSLDTSWKNNYYCSGQVFSDTSIDCCFADSRSKALGDKFPSVECSRSLL